MKNKSKFSLDQNENLVIKLDNGETEIIISTDKITIDTKLPVIVNSTVINNNIKNKLIN